MLKPRCVLNTHLHSRNSSSGSGSSSSSSDSIASLLNMTADLNVILGDGDAQLNLLLLYRLDVDECHLRAGGARHNQRRVT